jgi:hypothetical protein
MPRNGSLKVMVDESIETAPESESIIGKIFSCEDHDSDYSCQLGFEKRNNR